MKTSFTKSLVTLLTFAALGVAAGGAHADWGQRGPGHVFHAHQHKLLLAQQIDERQQRQMDRIHAGMRSGDLTRREFGELMREQHEIRTMEHRFWADGILDPHEFRHLDRALDVARRNIGMERHDAQARDGHGHRHAPWYN